MRLKGWPICARATRDIGEDGDLKFPAVGG